MKSKIYLTVIVATLSFVSLFAQTPVLQAYQPNVTHRNLQGSALWYTVKLKGHVDPNGVACQIYFEYGNTTAYGTTVAGSPASLDGSTASNDSVTFTDGHTTANLQLFVYHYRIKAVTASRTYYSRDLQFTVNPDPTQAIDIVATCTNAVDANFDMTNNGSEEIKKDFNDNVQIGYIAGLSVGNIDLPPAVTLQLKVAKYTICSFSFNSVVFRQVETNNQQCNVDPLPQYNFIACYGIGKLADGQGQLYKIRSSNTDPVTVTLTSDTYSQDVTMPPMTPFYVVTNGSELDMLYSGDTFLILSPSPTSWEGLSWVTASPISYDATTATFDLQNNDSTAHTMYLRNALGTEHSYTLAAYAHQTATVENCDWDIYVESPYSFVNLGYTGVNNHFKVGSVSPGTAPIVITQTVSLPTFATSNSMTLNGTITSNAAQDQQVTYHFNYGTDKSNLNVSTSTQTATLTNGVGTAVSASLTGLTSGTMYYYQLVTDSGSSSINSYLLDSSIPSSNLKLHLRSDAGVISSSSAVSEWDDCSGNGNNATQSTDANQPTFVSNSMNGNPVIRFDGNSSKLTLPVSSNLGIQSNPYEMFMVAKSSSSNTQFLIAGGANEQFEYHLNGGTQGARFIPITSTYLDEGSSGTYTDGNAHVFSERASSGGGAIRVDGNDGVTSSANILSSNSGALQLGVRSDGTNYFNGDIAEVILYNTVLSSSDRNTVEQYLASRYNITSGVLPVELTTFTAANVEGKVDLQWSTATEVNCYGFDVERSQKTEVSSPNPQWVKIGFVKGNGNSNSPKSYSFTDGPTINDKLQYRLKQIDNDGSFKYSNIVETSFMKPTEFSLGQNYPNPFNPATTIKYSIPKAEHVTLKVYDELGRKVATLVDENKAAGSYSVQFSIQQTTNNRQLSSGIYFYRITAGSYSEVKKLLLLK